MTLGDTIAAIASAPGRGGVAVIRVSGPDALSVAAQLTRTENGTAHGGLRVRKVYFPSAARPLVDEAVVLVFRAPHSYTGEDVVEFQCHGGTVTPRRMLAACLAAGARLARRGEFTERAFLNGRLDYEQAASVLDLVNARTDRAADAALEGLSGGKSRAYRALYDAALDLSTRIEHALDIDEGELPEGFSAGIADDALRLLSGVSAEIRRLREGKLLREGAFVVLAGPPNAGKSSLMNALLEENRAIVSDVPGTTRDSIEEGLDIDGWPIRLVDTAGLRTTDDAVEAEGVRRSEALIAGADVIVSLADAAATADDRVIRIHPKCDLCRGEGLNVSAKTGEGLDALRREIVARLERRLESGDSDEDLSADRLSALLDAQAALASVDMRPSMRNEDLDLVLAGNALRHAADRLGSLVGAVYTDDFLDKLFSRFCIGK